MNDILLYVQFFPTDLRGGSKRFLRPDEEVFVDFFNDFTFLLIRNHKVTFLCNVHIQYIILT